MRLQSSKFTHGEALTPSSANCGFYSIRMGVSYSALGWIMFATALSLTTFGLNGCVWLLLCALAFLFGTFLTLYIMYSPKVQQWTTISSSPCISQPAVGIMQLVAEMNKEKPSFRFERRMTSSQSIDELLHEIINYAYRDYIRTWYQRRISDDEEFHHNICQTVQRVIIAFSERAKDVDLTPYITTRLVDDFASHIRLYRRSLGKVIEHRKDDTKPPPDLESIFFDLETEMENNRICRDQICLSESEERQYLQDVAEVLMFLLLPPGDFHNTLFRYLVREVIVSGLLLPIIGLVSDPDFINQSVIYLCKDTMFTSDSFMTIVKTSDSVDELQAVKEKVDAEIARQRSNDTGGVDDTLIKQQLSSLTFVKTICDVRQQQLREGTADTDLLVSVDMGVVLAPGQRVPMLPFDVVFNNNVALSYFIDFMTGIGADRLVYFYLAVEGFRVSAEQQLSAAYLATGSDDIDRADLEMLTEAAVTLYNQYLSDKATPRLNIDESLVKVIGNKLQKNSLSETLFDDIQAKVWMIMQEDVRYFNAFRKSQLYLKLLAELNLLRDKTDEATTLPSMPASDLLQNGDLAAEVDLSQRRPSAEDLEVGLTCSDPVSANDGVINSHPQKNTVTLTASITDSGSCYEFGKEYTVYIISVMKRNSNGTMDSWDVWRRYSDFHDFHMLLQEKFDTLSGLMLPSKRAFDNKNRDFLEKRKIGLNVYLQTLLSPNLLNTHRGLMDLVQQFLEHMHWEREKTELARKMDSIVNPLRSSVRSVSNLVRSMPDNFVDGVVRVSGTFRTIPSNMLDGVGKMLNVKGATGMAPSIKADIIERGKVSASLDYEADEESIPLHIMLLLMDEVFDLKNRNQWLRRRINTILQGVAKTMFGDSINRKIVEQVCHLTSSDQIAEYIRLFRDSFWPNGTLAEQRLPRDHNTKMRTRVVCKSKLFASLSEELQHVVGSETTQKGMMLVFNMFQNPRLNRRLAYVIFEGVLETIFSENHFPETFQKLHSNSPRVRRDRTATETPSTATAANSCTTDSGRSSGGSVRRR